MKYVFVDINEKKVIDIYICLDCGELFCEPDKYSIVTEYWGNVCRTTYTGCPKCGGAYENAIKCDVCNEYINGKYVETDNGDVICDNCYIERDTGDG